MMIIETSANELYRVRETGNPALAPLLDRRRGKAPQGAVRPEGKPP